MKHIAALSPLLLVVSLAHGQNQTSTDEDLRHGYHLVNSPPQVTQPVSYEPHRNVGPSHVIGDGTPIRLRLKETLISGKVAVGDRIRFEVLDDVVVDGVLMIPGGSMAIGGVTMSRDRKPLGRAGRLRATLDYAVAASGEKVRLRQQKEQEVPGQVKNVGGGLTASDVVFGAIPFGQAFLLYGNGGDAQIPEGMELMSFVNGNQRVHEAQ